ncbi:MAG: pyridoxamine 5'-phosphate oxidase family protein [Actinomycetota bacterium]|nr:pyridoxamine 5'-phosphate oxidase family protein [Actinomycetota bacterium]
MNLRDQIRMSKEEISAFLNDQLSIQVGTVNKDGTPHLTTLWYTTDSDSIIFHTYTKSQKILNLTRDNRATILTESGDNYSNLKGIMIYSRANMIHGTSNQKKVLEIIEKVSAKYNDGSVSKDYLEAMENQAKKRSAVILNPIEYISWNHSKL